MPTSSAVVLNMGAGNPWVLWRGLGVLPISELYLYLLVNFR